MARTIEKLGRGLAGGAAGTAAMTVLKERL
jgi:hypothetical protein